MNLKTLVLDFSYPKFKLLNLPVSEIHLEQANAFIFNRSCRGNIKTAKSLRSRVPVGEFTHYLTSERHYTNRL